MVFGGELPPIDITLSKARGFEGKYVYGRRVGLLAKKIVGRKIVISTYRDLPEREVEDTLIHEMIHYYIHHKGLKDTSPHGRIFKKMMVEINMRWGRNITISKRLKADDIVVDEKVKPHFICVSTFRDGHRGITVCAKTRIFEIHRILTNAQTIAQVEWWGSTDPFFNRFPNSQSAKVYKIVEAELEEHLRGAVPLVCDGQIIKPR